MRALLSGVKTEMSLCFSISGASEEEDVLSSGGDLGQLVKGVTVSSCGFYSGSGFSGELEGADSESFWDVEESVVVSDGADEGDDRLFLLLVLVVGEGFRDSGDGHGVSVKSGLVKSFVDGFVEL